ncbi:MAG: hypothetical protein Q9195_004766 [Heterodermia aff. obscurata]
MVLDRRKITLFGAAAVLRLILFVAFPSLPKLLAGRVEISTPVTSFKRLQEGLFLYTHNVSPYDGGIFHQAPLLLPLFGLIPATAFSPLTSLLYILLDVLCAESLSQIADSGESRQTRLYKSPRRDLNWDGVTVGAAYLFNPLTIAACLGRPTSLFTNCAVLYAIAKACERRPFMAMVALGLASYLSLYPALFLPPLILLCFDARYKDEKQVPGVLSFALTHTAAFFSSIACFLFESFLLTGGSWEFISSTYGVQLLLPDLTPNVGLWWYFFIEMFDSFREFFLGVFWLHLGGYVGGLCVRLRTQPLFVITMLLGLCAIFKPYPGISDTALYLSLLPCYRHIFPLMRYTFFALATLLYASLLGPAFYYLWIYAGSGNANFFYAITLVWSLGLSVIVSDSLFAVLRDEWEVERPEMKGKDVRQI